MGTTEQHDGARFSSRSATGFALVEVIVALAVLAIGALGLARVLTATYALAELSDLRGRALDVLEVASAAIVSPSATWRPATELPPFAYVGVLDGTAPRCRWRVVELADDVSRLRIDVDCAKVDGTPSAHVRSLRVGR